MTMLRASCDRCGDVELPMPEVTVRRCVDNGELGYRFRCPVCAMFVVNAPLHPFVMHKMIQAGSPLENWQLPAELFERPHRARAAPICADDLIDFHEAIGQLPTAPVRARR